MTEDSAGLWIAIWTAMLLSCGLFLLLERRQPRRRPLWSLTWLLFGGVAGGLLVVDLVRLLS